MSESLARMREVFGDPLFVRSGLEMQPTPLAQDLAVPLREILERIESDLLHRGHFDPSTAKRAFTLVTPDIGELHLVPALLDWLMQHAPGITLRTIPRHPEATASTLESGEADLAVGHFPALHRSGFFQQKLFASRPVCLMRAGHRLQGERLSVEDYLAARHAVVQPDGRPPESVRIAVDHQSSIQVAVVVSHFTSLMSILTTTDLLAVGLAAAEGEVQRLKLRAYP